MHAGPTWAQKVTSLTPSPDQVYLDSLLNRSRAVLRGPFPELHKAPTKTLCQPVAYS